MTTHTRLDVAFNQDSTESSLLKSRVRFKLIHINPAEVKFLEGLAPVRSKSCAPADETLGIFTQYFQAEK